MLYFADAPTYFRIYRTVNAKMFLSYLGLGVIGVVDLVAVIPVLGLLGFGVLDLLWGQEVPVLLQAAGLHLLVVNLHLVGLVGI